MGRVSNIAAAGLPESWGTCEECEGSREIWETKEDKEKAEAWECIEPPPGDGYQVWNPADYHPCPITPVFQNIEELARYMEKNLGADLEKTYGHGQWLSILTSKNIVILKYRLGKKITTTLKNKDIDSEKFITSLKIDEDLRLGFRVCHFEHFEMDQLLDIWKSLEMAEAVK